MEVGREFLPMVANTWSDYEYEFEVSSSARMVTVFLDFMSSRARY